jgi:mannan endo-1,4-beta-mannosidase
MMMKRWLILLVVGLTFAVVGCGGQRSSAGEETEAPALVSGTEAETPTPTPEPSPAAPSWPVRERLPRPQDSKAVGGNEAVYPQSVTTYLASEATLYGSLEVMDDGAVGRFEQKDKDDQLEFVIEIEEKGFYRLEFEARTFGGYKENWLFIDGGLTDKLIADSEDYAPALVRQVWFEAGEHTIWIRAEWGWTAIMSLTVAGETSPFTEGLYNVPIKLVNPNADDNALGLMSFLAMNYGKVSLAGQQSQGDWGRNNGLFGGEAAFVYEQTGKRPAVIGLDMIDYSLSRVANGNTSREVEAALEAWENNAIVTFCWHWNAPTPYIDGTWWSAFYTDHSKKGFFKKIMDGDDPAGYQLLLDDIDAIAVQLTRLRDAGVPVLWRPLHEASGGWFWWGTDRDSYLKLYKLLYERLTVEHNLTNLIWVWNGQHREWYPGDEYVDIIGEDVYLNNPHVYTSQINRFLTAAAYTDEPKIIAMTENGALFDPELARRDGAVWSWWCVWNGDFVTTEAHTEFDMLRQVYDSEYVLTLEELPDLKTYPIYVD